MNIHDQHVYVSSELCLPEQTLSQRVMVLGSNGSTNVNGWRGSRVSTVKHLTY